MKKIFTVIFIALFSFQMQGQNYTIPKPEPGKVYATCVHPLDTSHKEKRVLKVAFPQWKKSIDTIFKTSENIQKVTIKPTAIWWNFRHTDTRCLSAEPTDCIGLASIKIPEQTRIIQFAENDSFKIVQVERLTRSASISFTTPDSVNFDAMEKVELEKTPSLIYFKDTIDRVMYVIPNSSHSLHWYENTPQCTTTITAPTVRQVQEKLREKGYDCPVDNVMGKETKAALVQLKRDKGIPIGIDETRMLLNELFPSPPPSEDDLKLKSLNEW